MADKGTGRMKLLLMILMFIGTQNALAQITRIAQSSAVTTGGGAASVVVTTPAGTALNDVMIGVVSVRGSGQTINVPAGWTAVPGLSSSVGTNMNQEVFFRVATATEPASYTFSWSVSGRAVAAIVTYRNVELTSPINASGAQTSASSANIIAPSITTTIASTMLVGFFGDAHGGATFTIPAGMTNIFGSGGEPTSGAGLNGVRTLIAEQTQVAFGATGTRTAVSTQTVDNIGHILALSPASVGALAPGGFNGFETITAAGSITGVINTKTSGGTVSLDIIALNVAKDAVLTTFTGAVRVEVLDSSSNSGILDANSCRSTWTTIQTLSPDPAFVAGNNGRITVSFTVPDAYRDARLRITYPAGAPTTTGCSTDNFAIRPSTFSGLGVSDDGTWLNAGTGRALNDATFGSTMHKAGRPLSVRANAVNAAAAPAITVNYSGTPNATLTACAGAACTATFGTLTLSTAFSAGQLVSDIANYDNVGAFQLQLIDSSFASVDASDTAADCTAAGRHICSAVVVVGRFVPDHFAVSYNTPEFGTVCSSGGFTYVGQPFTYVTAPVITAQAQNAANGVTTLYTGSWWRITSGSLTGKAYSAASGTLDVSGISGADPVINDAGTGSGSLTFGSGTGLLFTRTSPITPFNAEISLAINVIDADGVAFAGNPAAFGAATAGNGVAFSSGKAMRFGRLRLQNAFGPLGNDLPVTLLAEHWNGTAFSTNTLDSCLSLAAGNFALSGYVGGITAANMKPGAPAAGNVSVGGAFANGVGTLRLTKPSPAAATPGGVVVCADLDGGTPTDATCVATTPANRPWLKGNWGNATTYSDDPKSRATFGLFGVQPRQFIYLREYY